jgi:hypothetical protein
VRFTVANAREMAARSVAKRKATEAKRTAWPACIPLPGAAPADPDPGINVASVRARLETLDGLMARAKKNREWDNLSRAFDRLFRVWCVLTQTAFPGTLRPSERRKSARGAPYWRERWAYAGPLVPVEAPVEVLPSPQAAEMRGPPDGDKGELREGPIAAEGQAEQPPQSAKDTQRERWLAMTPAERTAVLAARQRAKLSAQVVTQPPVLTAKASAG